MASRTVFWTWFLKITSDPREDAWSSQTTSVISSKQPQVPSRDGKGCLPRYKNPGPPLQPQIPSWEGTGRLPRTRTTRGHGRQHQAPALLPTSPDFDRFGSAVHRRRASTGFNNSFLLTQKKTWQNGRQDGRQKPEVHEIHQNQWGSCQGQTWWGEFQMISIKLRQRIAQARNLMNWQKSDSHINKKNPSFSPLSLSTRGGCYGYLSSIIILQLCIYINHAITLMLR